MERRDAVLEAARLARSGLDTTVGWHYTTGSRPATGINHCWYYSEFVDEPIGGHVCHLDLESPPPLPQCCSRGAVQRHLARRPALHQSRT